MRRSESRSSSQRGVVAAGALLAAGAWVMAGSGDQAGEKGVRLVRDDAKQRVDVFVDGQPVD